MAIKAIWKVEDDGNDYETKEQAQIAEALKNSERYYNSNDLLCIAKTIDENFYIRSNKLEQGLQKEIADSIEGGRQAAKEIFGDPKE